MTAPRPEWYPDPTGRHEYRYHDGHAWTSHVSDRGITGSDPLEPGAPLAAPGTRFDRLDLGLTVGDESRTVSQQISAGGRRGIGLDRPVEGGGGTIFDEPILVVNQKAKVIELTNQYSVFDQHGNRIAAVEQVGQSTAKKVLRLVSSVDQFLTHHLHVRDAEGRVLLQLTRPAKVVKSKVIVSDGQGRELGRIVQHNVFGKINFGLDDAEGRQIGTIKAENWRAWNFRIEDAGGTEVARITKTWEGLAKTMFTTADNYVVQVHQRPAAPLDSLVVASALSIDTALKQDSRGLG